MLFSAVMLPNIEFFGCLFQLVKKLKNCGIALIIEHRLFFEESRSFRYQLSSQFSVLNVFSMKLLLNFSAEDFSTPKFT